MMFRALQDTWSDRLSSLTIQSVHSYFGNSLHRIDVPAAAALMAWVSFSVPGREGPESSAGVDTIALLKFGIRLFVIVYFGWELCYRLRPRQWRHNSTVDSHAICSRMLIPWFTFAGWACLSIVWSPLTMVSLGQWLGLLALILFAEAVSKRHTTGYLAGRTSQSATSVELHAHSRLRGTDCRESLGLLNVILAVYCGSVLVVHLLLPSVSGLDRSVSFQGSNGVFHPTAVAAASSLGLVLVIATFAVNQSTRSGLLLLSLLLHAVVLYFSASRAGLVMAGVGILATATLLMSSRMLGLLLLLAGALILCVIAVDPGISLTGEMLDGVVGYIKRGQSMEQLQGVSGRAELWQAVWKEFEESPALGHGYFVTSSQGRLDVWDGPANHDAHNVLLQALVSTGLIGAALLVWALANSVVGLLQAYRLQSRSFAGRDNSGMFVRLSCVVMLWYAGWCQGCVSFLGPVRPESVVFFLLLGVLAGYREVADLSATREMSEGRTT